MSSNFGVLELVQQKVPIINGIRGNKYTTIISTQFFWQVLLARAVQDGAIPPLNSPADRFTDEEMERRLQSLTAALLDGISADDFDTAIAVFKTSCEQKGVATGDNLMELAKRVCCICFADDDEVHALVSEHIAQDYSILTPLMPSLGPGLFMSHVLPFIRTPFWRLAESDWENIGQDKLALTSGVREGLPIIVQMVEQSPLSRENSVWHFALICYDLSYLYQRIFGEDVV